MAATVSANLVDIVSQINSAPVVEKKKSVKKTPAAAVVVNIAAPKPVKRLATISKTQFSKTLKFYTDDSSVLGNTAEVVLLALKEAVASRASAPTKPS